MWQNVLKRMESGSAEFVDLNHSREPEGAGPGLYRFQATSITIRVDKLECNEEETRELLNVDAAGPTATWLHTSARVSTCKHRSLL